MPLLAITYALATGSIQNGEHYSAPLPEFDPLTHGRLFADMSIEDDEARTADLVARYNAVRDAIPRPEPVPAPEQVPPAVTRRQLLLELNASTPRITFAGIEAILPSLGLSEQALEDAYIELENAQTFERQHPLVAVIKAALNVDDAWCDDRWRGAAKR